MLSHLFYFFYIIRLPSFIKEWLQRAIETEENKPTFTRNCFDPVLFFSFLCIRSEININRTIIVLPFGPVYWLTLGNGSPLRSIERLV